ncbi:MAG: ComEA family DNA-binding protein, partial [Gemmataceae bacterium]
MDRPQGKDTAPSAPSDRERPVAILLAIILLVFLFRSYGPGTAPQPSQLVSRPAIKLDLNRADREELLQLPGVGPRLADAIVLHREKHSPFATVQELTGVHGIGPKLLRDLEPWVEVRPAIVITGPAPEEVPELKRVARPLVNTAPAPAPPASASTSRKIQPGEGTIAVNTASAEELQRLPGIGVALAGRIVAER